MSLKEQVQSDMLLAMKAREELKLSVLRMLKASIMKWEVSGGERREACDADVADLIKKEAKQRQDSITAYREGNREDLTKLEEEELAILKTYMPEQLSEAEIEKAVKEVMVKLGASSLSDFGKVMKESMVQLKGKADGMLVKQVVERVIRN